MRGLAYTFRKKSVVTKMPCEKGLCPFLTKMKETSCGKVHANAAPIDKGAPMEKGAYDQKKVSVRRFALLVNLVDVFLFSFRGVSPTSCEYIPFLFHLSKLSELELLPLPFPAATAS